MKKIVLLILAAAALLQAGCAFTRYGEFTRLSLGNRMDIDGLDVQVATNGTKRIKLDRLRNDQVEAFKAGLEKGESIGKKAAGL